MCSVVCGVRCVVFKVYRMQKHIISAQTDWVVYKLFPGSREELKGNLVDGFEMFYGTRQKLRKLTVAVYRNLTGFNRSV